MNIKIIYSLLLLLMICACSTNGESEADCKDKNCANYISQSAAQAAYDADPICRNDLDQDKDGIACEEPGNSVKDCNTTSNCGCSGQNKSPCQLDPCCRWVVGEGCKCR